MKGEHFSIFSLFPDFLHFCYNLSTILVSFLLSYINTCLLPPLLSFVLNSFLPLSLLPLFCLYTPLPPSSACLSQSLLFMKVNLQVYQELLAGGGLRCSNHNKASPSTWNRNSIVGILGYFHRHTLHMIVHSHLSLSANEHPCFVPTFFLCVLPRSIIFLMSGWVVFLLFFFFPHLYCSIQHLFFIGLQGAVNQWWAPLFNQHMCCTVFHTPLL